MARDVLLLVLLFLGGVGYVALDTLRILLASRGRRVVAAVLGAVEVVVFLLAVSKVLSGPLEAANVIAYALGFGVGTFVGVWLEERLALGMVLALVITERDAGELLRALGERRFGITQVAARGQFDRRRIIFSIIRRRQMHDFLGLVKHYHPRAFVSFEDVRSVRDAFMAPQLGGRRFPWWRRRPTTEPPGRHESV